MALATPLRKAYEFDRIAEVYDSHRMHPPAVSAQIGTAIAGIAGIDARVLELGIGTARIAAPVAQAGCRVVGLDRSHEMLLQSQAKGFDLLTRGDLLHLPLRDASVDAVMAVHVLHHVADWRGALAEALRVVRPGGVLIQGADWHDPLSCTAQLRAALRNAVIEMRPAMKPPGAGAPLTQVLARLGGVTEPEQIAASWTMCTSPAENLERMAARIHPETWALDDELLDAVLVRVRAVATAKWPDLQAAQEYERRFVLTVTRKAIP